MLDAAGNIHAAEWFCEARFESLDLVLVQAGERLVSERSVANSF